jgi:outer membrane protein OmpA-like peptidoglycan-associated protein
MKYLLFLIISVGIWQPGWCQDNDTITYAQGTIVSATTKEPVIASISYKSLPYGSKAGFLSGSSFNFPLFDNEKYSLTVEAPGYAPSKFMIDPAEANADRKVIKNIELGLPVSAVKVAEETRTVGKLMRLDNLIFDVGTSKIETSTFEELDQVVKMLKDNPKMIIQLEGHTDVTGSPARNMKLSEDRVNAVKNYLASKGGSKSRIKTKAFGGSQPLSREDTEEAHALNRRVELRVLQN